MKKFIFAVTLAFSQFAFAQFPGIDNPWGDEVDIQALLDELQIDCASGDFMACVALELYSECTNGNTEACEELISIYEANEEEDNDNEWPWDNDGWGDSTDVENSVIEILCSNGETFEVNLFQMINMSTEEFIYSICGEEGYEYWNGPGWDDDFWDFDSTDVDNPWGDDDDIQMLLAELSDACASGDFMACGALELYTECTNGNSESCEELISIYESNEDDDDDEDEGNCYDDVFPGMGNIDINSVFGGIEMTDQDIIFVVESSDFIISIMNENGISFVPEEIDGYLIFGPFSLEEIYTFIVEGLGNSEIDWGMFRPENQEIIAQGTFNEENNSLPVIFNSSSMSLEDLNEEYIVYSTNYFDLMGRKIVEPKPNTIYIELKSTNFGSLKEKKYYYR